MPEYNNNPAPEYECKTIGKHEFSLVAIDPSGEASKLDKHSVRAYRLWLIILLVISGIIAIGIVLRYFSGNDPRFWKLNSKTFPDNSLDKESVEKINSGWHGPIDIASYWSCWEKRAIIPLCQLGVPIDKDWGVGANNGKAELVLSESTSATEKGDKRVKDPSSELQNNPSTMTLRSYNNNRLLQITAYNSSKTVMTARWIKIDTSKDWADNSHLLCRLFFTFLILLIISVITAAFAV